ncbi:MAG: bacteriohemerythrin [Pseudomonadota bacterium]
MYHIGIEVIDRQHAEWLLIVEEFRAVGATELLNPAGFEAAEHALSKLVGYSERHFATEERLMAEYGYPDTEGHIESHRAFSLNLAKMHSEIKLHKHSMAPLKLNLLATIWLFEHITREDMKFGQFVNGSA